MGTFNLIFFSIRIHHQTICFFCGIYTDTFGWKYKQLNEVEGGFLFNILNGVKREVNNLGSAIFQNIF
jgi:hypothetical protein